MLPWLIIDWNKAMETVEYLSIMIGKAGYINSSQMGWENSSKCNVVPIF
jgi:hypothetical protein